jgi:acetyl-CoA C-acetyltransferase
VTIESWTVLYERDGSPSFAIVAALTPAGARVFANERKPDSIDVLLSENVRGTAATLRDDGSLDW